MCFNAINSANQITDMNDDTLICYRKQPLDKRPSSGYLRFGDISGESSTDIQAPFSHLYKFKNQLKDDDEGNQLYIELVCVV